MHLFIHRGLPEPDDVNKQHTQNQQTVSRFFMHQTTKTHIDIGLAIRQKMSEQGTSIAWLARQIDCDRSNLYRQLHHAHIHPELLLKISVALKTDFFTHYAQRFQQTVENKQNNAHCCNINNK